VEEEPHPVADAELAELRGERDEVVVVHPDDVVGLDQLGERPGEEPVDAEISREVLAREIREVEAVVEEGPERTVGEAGIILVEVALGEIDERVVDIAFGPYMDAVRLALAAGFARPAEP
jgi:hypothetical protein